MYAVLATGGKQYKVSAGDFITVEKLDKNVGDEVVFDKVIMLSNEGTVLSSPKELEGKTVTGKVVRQDKAKKVTVGKFKKRHNYRRKIGHRQPYTAVVISEISA